VNLFLRLTKNFLKLFHGNLQRRGKDIMKTPRFNITIVTAVAVGTLILIVSTAQAEWPKKFGRVQPLCGALQERSSL